MKKETIAGLIAVAAIVAVVIFAGCIGSTTTIYDIEEHPDKYIDKRVTIEAVPGNYLGHTGGDTYGVFKGFWISDKEKDIFVAYDGEYPSITIKDEWGRETRYPSLKIEGMVRHKYMRIGIVETGVFYIEGESWEYID